MKTTVLNGQIELFSFIDNDACERVKTFATLPANMRADWEGQSVNLIDWKIADDGKTVKLTYQIRDDVYAPILDAILACDQTRTKLIPPGRSKAWQWRPMWSYWFNTKTGERVTP